MDVFTIEPVSEVENMKHHPAAAARHVIQRLWLPFLAVLPIVLAACNQKGGPTY